MKNFLKKILIVALSFAAFAPIVYGATVLTVPQGGTGAASHVSNGIIFGGTATNGAYVSDSSHTINPVNGNTDLRAASGGSHGNAFIDAAGVTIEQTNTTLQYESAVDLSSTGAQIGYANTLTNKSSIGEFTPAHIGFEHFPDNTGFESFLVAEDDNAAIGVFDGTEVSQFKASANRFEAFQTGTPIINYFLVTDITTRFGYDAGANNGALDSTFIGLSAGHTNTSGYSQTFVGSSAGFSNGGAINNTYVGAFAGLRMNGNDNVAFGVHALEGAVNASSQRNVVLGNFAGQSLNTNGANVLIGFNAGNGFTGGNAVMIGYEAGIASSAAFSNVFIGYQSGKLTGSGANNMFLGALSAQDNTTGSFNVCMGDNACAVTETGNGLIMLGSGTSVDVDGWDDSIALGRDAQITASNQFIVGSAGHKNKEVKFGDWTTAGGTYFTLGGLNPDMAVMNFGTQYRRSEVNNIDLAISTLAFHYITMINLSVDRHVTLPPCGTGSANLADNGYELTIKNKYDNVHNVIVDTPGGETIDGALTKTLTPTQAITIVSDGVAGGTCNWDVISQI